TSGYWMIDGQVRSDLKSGHGFKLDNSTNTIGAGRLGSFYAIQIAGCGPGNTCTPTFRNVTVRYVEIAGGGKCSNTGDSYTISSISRNSAGTQATVVTNTNTRALAKSATVAGSQLA